MHKKISLIHIKANHKGRVVEISGGGVLSDKLANMGVYKGKEVTKLSHIDRKSVV